MFGDLPTYVTVNDTPYSINTDFRVVIQAILPFTDPELTDGEKLYKFLTTIYADFGSIPEDDYEDAIKAAVTFVDNGLEDKQTKKPAPRTVDWEQDEQIMLPAVNKVAGFDVRTKDYLHWWTFLGYYLEIGEGVFAQVVTIRSKKARHINLEKHEREFYKKNKALCDLKPKISKEEREIQDRLKALLD